MPFKSKAQMRFLFAKKPELAKEFADKQKAEGKSFSNMPEKSMGPKNPWAKMKKGGM